MFIKSSPVIWLDWFDYTLVSDFISLSFFNSFLSYLWLPFSLKAWINIFLTVAFSVSLVLLFSLFSHFSFYILYFLLSIFFNSISLNFLPSSFLSFFQHISLSLSSFFTSLKRFSPFRSSIYSIYIILIRRFCVTFIFTTWLTRVFMMRYRLSSCSSISAEVYYFAVNRSFS